MRNTVETIIVIIFVAALCVLTFTAVHNYTHNLQDTTVQQELEQRVSNLERQCAGK